ncbi:MAG: tetratricopeptide repeat protein [Chloroflexi bacterium]|nr:tetratricopeptide repeat protein [Chloroflexota bacterium]
MVENNEKFQEAMNQGHSAAWDQNWESAADFYRHALEEIPDQYQALMNLGLALYELQKFPDALACYERAATLQPDDPLPVEKSADIHERNGDLNESAVKSIKAADLYLNIKDADKAIENWTRVVRLMPEHLAAHSRLALVHEKLGRKQQSITEYLAVASLLQHKGELEDAFETVKHALTLNPKSKEALQTMELLQANKSLPKPIRQRGSTGPLRMASLKEMEQPEPEGFDSEVFSRESPDPIAEARQKALTTLAGLLFDVPDEPEATVESAGDLKSLARGVTTSLMAPGPDRTLISLHIGQAIDLQTRGKDKDAAEELKRLVEAGFDHPAAYFNLGLILSNTGRKESAQRNLQRSVTHSDFTLAARLLIGEHIREKGRLNDAVVEYLEALKVADSSVVPPENAEDLRQLYEPLIEAQSQEEDEAALDQLCNNIVELLIRPNWRSQLIEARKQLPDSGNSGAPAPLADILTHAKSSQIVTIMAQINQLARDGHLRSAMEEAFVVLDYAPTYLPLHIQMGELLLRQNRTEEAITKFKIVAQTYGSRGEASRSTDMFTRIVELSPMDLSTRNSLIDQLIARGETDQALNEYINMADIHYHLAELNLARATYEKALRVAQQTNADGKWNVKILHHMADIDLQRLDWRQAVRVYEQIRTLQPEDEIARSSLIDLNVRLGQKNQAQAELDNYISHLIGTAKETTALNFLENLLEDKPELTFARRRLAEIYQQAARVEDAIAQWDKVGEALLEAGNNEGAIEAIRAILVLKPPNPDQYQTLLRKLESGIGS